MNQKKHKTTIHVLLLSVAIITLLLSSCGTKSPSEKMIREDLTNSLSSSYPFLTLSEMEVTQSLTEEESYAATVSVSADAKYATHDLIAEISYLCYDQGWEMTNCFWSELGYEVVSCPSAQEMEDIVHADESIDSILRNQSYVNMEILDAYAIRYEGFVSNNENTCIARTCNVKSIWEYDPSCGTWIFSATESEDWLFDLSRLEGTWPAYDGETVTISNVTEDSFDIDWSYYDMEPVRVCRTESPDFFFPNSSTQVTYGATGFSCTAQIEGKAYVAKDSVFETSITIKDSNTVEMRCFFSANNTSGDGCLITTGATIND